ncbi:MAG: cysteine desulfurase, partial [Oscillospiraceae bacterium]|nr:cysteine desulfurase [Oscillospiraceae bacterium]
MENLKNIVQSELFSDLEQLIYLDNAATTKPSDEVIRSVALHMADCYGNPSSLHGLGLQAQLRIEQARKIIANSMGVDPETILFTSGATESNNLAIRGASGTYGRRKKHIITSAVEHASVRNTIRKLEEQGYTVTRIVPDENGQFRAQDFIDAVTDQTFLISIMLVENETGRILPVRDVFRKIKKKYPQIITHCDAVQAYMKIPVKISTLQADLLSVSAHKIHGIKGAGALYVRKGVRLEPIMTGGSQEKSLRPGTESVPLIYGFGQAVTEMQNSIETRYQKAMSNKNYLVKLLAEMPDISINSDNSDPETDKNLENSNNSPYIVNFSVKHIRSEIMLHYLEHRNIYVSSGSACSKGAKSGVLSAYRIPEQLADCAIRVSF